MRIGVSVLLLLFMTSAALAQGAGGDKIKVIVDDGDLSAPPAIPSPEVEEVPALKAQEAEPAKEKPKVTITWHKKDKEEPAKESMPAEEPEQTAEKTEPEMEGQATEAQRAEALLVKSAKEAAQQEAAKEGKKIIIKEKPEETAKIEIVENGDEQEEIIWNNIAPAAPGNNISPYPNEVINWNDPVQAVTQEEALDIALLSIENETVQGIKVKYHEDHLDMQLYEILVKTDKADHVIWINEMTGDILGSAPQ